MLASIRAIDTNNALLAGDLTAHTVAGLLIQGSALLKKASAQWQVDMSEVEQVTSAAAALLLEWVKLSRQLQVEFSIKNFPEQLKPILEVSDLSTIFQPLLRPVV